MGQAGLKEGLAGAGAAVGDKDDALVDSAHTVLLQSSRLVPIGIPSNEDASQSSRSLLAAGFESEQDTFFPLTLCLVLHDSVMAGAGDAVTADAAMDDVLVSPQGKMPPAEGKESASFDILLFCYVASERLTGVASQPGDGKG